MGSIKFGKKDLLRKYTLMVVSLDILEINRFQYLVFSYLRFSMMSYFVWKKVSNIWWENRSKSGETDWPKQSGGSFRRNVEKWWIIGGSLLMHRPRHIKYSIGPARPSGDKQEEDCIGERIHWHHWHTNTHVILYICESYTELLVLVCLWQKR